MKRQWTILGVAIAAALVMTVGIAAADEKSPLHHVMEKVQASNIAITKAVKTPVAFTKDRGKAEKAAKELKKLGEQSKKMKDAVKAASKKVKDADKQWDKFSDDFIKSADALATLLSESGTSQKAAKDEFGKVKTTCTACHNVFRAEEEEFK